MPLGTVHVHEPVPVDAVTSYVDPARDTVDVLDVQSGLAGRRSGERNGCDAAHHRHRRQRAEQFCSAWASG